MCSVNTLIVVFYFQNVLELEEPSTIAIPDEKPTSKVIIS